jgi:hypothetical protein
MVELLVGLVIGALLITVIMRMVTGQTRFALVQSAREEVQQNARGAVEIVGSELRGVLAQGIVRAEEKELILMLPRLWGVSCGLAGADIVAVFPAAPGLTFPTGEGRGLLVFSDGVWKGRATNLNLNQRLGISGVGPFVLGTMAPPPCNSISPEGAVVAFRLSGSNYAGSNPAPGSIVVVYELVRYDVSQLADGDWWLRRSNGWVSGGGMTGFATTMQPLAGPVNPDSVRFTYFAGLPPTVIPAPGSDQAAQATVRLVRFDVRTLSRTRLDGVVQQEEEGAVTVQLRNW